MRVLMSWSTWLPLALLLVSATPGWAQTVQGTVTDEITDDPIASAEVAVLDADETVVAQSVSDEDGQFEVRLPDEAPYHLRVARIGYATSTSTVFSVAPGQTAFTDLRLGIDPVVLDPIEAVVDGQFAVLARGGFYTREQVGLGYFLTPEDMDTKPGLITLDDLFNRAPGVAVRFEDFGTSFDVFSTRGPGGCRMSVAIDRIIVQIGGRGRASMYWSNMIRMPEIAALEVYPNRTGVPEWMGGHRAECGAVVIWTKGYVN